jgi:hypothetical protein
MLDYCNGFASIVQRLSRGNRKSGNRCVWIQGGIPHIKRSGFLSDQINKDRFTLRSENDQNVMT